MDYGITAVDTHYLRPRFDASHLIVRDGRAAFVDTGTNDSVPRLMDALKAKGLDPEQVDYVFVTHVHLDHAGGAGLLMQALPNAKTVAHPRGARHLIQPDRLIRGAKAVYGEAEFSRHYGNIRAIDEQRVLAVEDGELIDWGGDRLELIHTPGHARHHYCIVDHRSNGIFTGDSFGISYRELDTKHGAFIFPTTTPVQFDPDAAHATIDRLVGYAPECVYLTHFSRVTDVPRLARDLHTDLDAMVAIGLDCRTTGAQRVERIETAIGDYLRDRARSHGCTLGDTEIDALLDVDVKLNAQGIDIWLERMEKGKARHG